MKVMTQFLLFVSLVLGPQIYADGVNSTEPIHMNISSRVGLTYIGQQPDGSALAVVCGYSWGRWSADLVFPVKQSNSQVPELTLDTYRNSRIGNDGSLKSPYTVLSNRAAETVCTEKADGFTFVKVDGQMRVVHLSAARVSPKEQRQIEAAAED